MKRSTRNLIIGHAIFGAAALGLIPVSEWIGDVPVSAVTLPQGAAVVVLFGVMLFGAFYSHKR